MSLLSVICSFFIIPRNVFIVNRKDCRRKLKIHDILISSTLLFSFDGWLYRKKSAPWSELCNTLNLAREKTLLKTLCEKPFTQCFFFFLDCLTFSDWSLFRRKRKVRQRSLCYVSVGQRKNCKLFGFVWKASERGF